MGCRYLLAEISNGFLDCDQIHCLRVSNNRSYQALFRSDRNTDVNVVPVDNGVTTIRALDRKSVV